MELRESSWHARYYKLVTRGENFPKDFCTYFWRLMFYSAGGLLLLAFCLIILASVFAPFIAIFFNTGLENNELFVFLVFLGVVAWLCSILFFIIQLIVSTREKIIDKKWDKEYEQKMNGTYRPKGPNLIVKAFKDYKAKHCSIIEWKY